MLLYATLDTTDIEVLTGFTEKELVATGVISKIWSNEDGTKTLVVNPSHEYLRDRGVENIKQVFEVIENLKNNYGMECVRLKRRDLAFDYDEPFEKLERKLLIVMGVMAVGLKALHTGKRMTPFTNILKTQGYQFKTKNNKREIVLYNKAEQSQGQHISKTRVEFKKYLNKAYTREALLKEVDDLINQLDKAIDYLETYEEFVIDNLARTYQDGIKEGFYKDFSGFIRFNQRLVSTLGVFKGLHKKLYPGKSTAKKTLQNIRRTLELELYTKGDIKKEIVEMKKKLRTFKKIR